MGIGAFLFGVFWGICMLAVFVYLILGSGVVILREDCSLYGYDGDENPDGIDVLLETPRVLGVFRTLLWVVIAAAWPVVVVIGFVLTLLYLEKEELSERLSRIADWVFLGFGKFVPPKS